MSPGGVFTEGQWRGIVERANRRCERCGTACTGFRGLSWSIQHRKARGMGGTSRAVTLADGALLCGSATTGCHGYVETHPDTAEWEGWRVPSYGDPAKTPVKHVDHGWTLLDPDGGYITASAVPSEIEVLTKRVTCRRCGRVIVDDSDDDDFIDAMLALHALSDHPEARE